MEYAYRRNHTKVTEEDMLSAVEWRDMSRIQQLRAEADALVHRTTLSWMFERQRREVAYSLQQLELDGE